jgi:hypothetical protein
VRAEGKEFLEERTPGWERAWWTQVAERSPVCMNRVSKGQILEGWERSGQVGLSDWVHKIRFSLFFETGPHYVAQADLELMLLLPQSPDC